VLVFIFKGFGHEETNCAEKNDVGVHWSLTTHSFYWLKIMWFNHVIVLWPHCNVDGTCWLSTHLIRCDLFHALFFVTPARTKAPMWIDGALMGVPFSSLHVHKLTKVANFFLIL
jgi:hypothetical protein